MTSKWLAAFLEAEDNPWALSETRAKSANNAKSLPTASATGSIGTNDTIGTGRETEEPADTGELSALMALSAQADALDERAALVEHGAEVHREWAEGFAALSCMPAPHGFSPERWQRIIDAAGRFLDRWALEAARCGWKALDVFGCHPARPAARFDHMGLIPLLVGANVASIDERGADLVTIVGGTRQRFRRRPLPPGTIALWDLARQ